MNLQPPTIGTPVMLRDESENMFHSRIEGATGDVIVVVRPLDLPASMTVRPGLELDLLWAEGSGVHVVPTRLSDQSIENVVRLWHLEVVGDVTTEQRREYVRAPLEAVVRFEVPSAAPNITSWPDEPVDAAFIDISEVALQASVMLPAGADEIPEGAAVECVFTLGGIDYRLPGTVLFVRRGSSARERRPVVQFEASQSEHDSIRREVFAIEVARRRAQRDR